MTTVEQVHALLRVFETNMDADPRADIVCVFRLRTLYRAMVVIALPRWDIAYNVDERRLTSRETK